MTTLVPTEYISVKTLGAKGDGTTDDTAAIQLAMSTGGNIYFPKGTYKVTSVITIVSNTTLFADKNATILSSIVSVPLSYQQIFVASVAVSNISVKGLKFQTSQVAFAALGFQKLVTNLTLTDNECQGCALVTTFEGVANALIEGNYIHSPAHEGTTNDYARAIQISCGFSGTGTSNLNVSNNTILGSWTHGIEVFGGDVMASVVPTNAKNINGVVVQGNIVKAVSSTYSAGAIWFSQAADISVIGNHCELYGDVGIDFEACRNAVASGNTLRNNNKNLAMYGNSLTVLFTSNTCYNTVAGLSMFYAKPANNNTVDYQVDARNTDITLEGNKFFNAATPTGLERLEMGSGGIITVSDNTLTNCTINARYMSLTEIIIKNNKITHNDFSVGMIPIQVNQSYKTGDATTNTFKATIAENIVELSNPVAGLAFCVLYQIGDTVGASVDFDYKVDIYNNDLRIPTTKNSIYAQSSATTTTGTKSIDISIHNNKCWGQITIIETGTHVERKYVNANLNIAGQPFSWPVTTSATYDSWRDSLTIDTTAGVINGNFPDGDFNGQQRYLVMTVDGGDATVNILNYRTASPTVATFSAVGQYALLQWNVDKWDKIAATCAGI